ncbi:hypothetical protein GW796_06890 [archaeon]|nr:hypothetical protein [archaeon]
MTKKFFYLSILLLSVKSFALTGRQEFVVPYDNADLVFINDIRRLVVLEFKTQSKLTTKEEVRCGVAKMDGNKAKFGENNIIFGDKFAKVNSRIYYYKETKTDLFFYNSLCPALQK